MTDHVTYGILMMHIGCGRKGVHVDLLDAAYEARSLSHVYDLEAPLADLITPHGCIPAKPNPIIKMTLDEKVFSSRIINREMKRG